MPGVDVLNEVVQTPDKASGMIVMYVFFAIVMLVFAGMLIYALYSSFSSTYMDWKDWIGVVIMCLLIGGFLLGAVALALAIPGEANRRETIVYATIDDSVSWSEINARYELVRQDGKIYQLRVKDGSEQQGGAK